MVQYVAVPHSELHYLAQEDTALLWTAWPVRERRGRVVLQLDLCAWSCAGEIQKNVSALTGVRCGFSRRSDERSCEMICT